MVVVLKEDLCGLLGEVTHGTILSLLGLLHLDNGKVSNLGSLKDTDASHKDEEDNNGSSWGDGFPYGGLFLENSNERNGKGETEKRQRHDASTVEEDVLE